MRTIKDELFFAIVNDEVRFSYSARDAEAEYILEIEIDVPDEKDKVLLETLTDITADDGFCPVCRPINKWGHTNSCPVRIAIDTLRPRPPRATIREVEKP